MRLTQKQETFCLKYFELGNASEAARIAKYSPKTAAVIGRENLLKPQIQARIDELRQVAQDASVANVLERQQILTEIARANIPDFISGDGVEVKKESANVGAVSEITTKTKVYRRGGEPVIITNLKLHNPIPAIDLLNKMDKLYEAEGGMTINNQTLIINVRTEETKNLLSEIAEGVAPHGADSD